MLFTALALLTAYRSFVRAASMPKTEVTTDTIGKSEGACSPDEGTQHILATYLRQRRCMHGELPSLWRYTTGFGVAAG